MGTWLSAHIYQSMESNPQNSNLMTGINPHSRSKLGSAWWPHHSQKCSCCARPKSMQNISLKSEHNFISQLSKTPGTNHSFLDPIIMIQITCKSLSVLSCPTGYSAKKFPQSRQTFSTIILTYNFSIHARTRTLTNGTNCTILLMEVIQCHQANSASNSSSMKQE